VNVVFLEWMVMILIFAGVGNFALLIYVSHKKLDLIESYFKKTKIIIDTKTMWGAAGSLGKIHRSGMIFATLIFANQWSKRGLVDLTEIAELPTVLKRWISFPMIASPILIGVIAILLKKLGRL
jgi:hypothetical protein